MRLRRSRTPQPDPSSSTDPRSIAAAVDAVARGSAQNHRLVVFESMSGRQYSDSPRAIYEELVRQDVDATAVWSVRRGATDFPAGVRTVARRSPEWIEALGTATAWVDNQGFPRWLRKPERVHYLQTWHGTPLKVMGWNDSTVAGLEASSRQELQAVYDRWDAVTAPSEYFVETIVDAFDAKAEVLRVGTPRNDVLVRGHSADDIARRRRDLGLNDHVTTILFAPTRTADPAVSRGRWAAASALATPRTQVLYRGHYSDAPVAADAGSRVTDVSHIPDMADLLVVADVLVTDYSSSMFDFALTDRPIVLFQPDQAAYLGDRGAYFDIREFAPGPIATTTDDLKGLAGSAADWDGEWAPRRAEYRDRFGQYETGRAAERVVREYLAPLLAGAST